MMLLKISSLVLQNFKMWMCCNFFLTQTPQVPSMSRGKKKHMCDTLIIITKNRRAFLQDSHKLNVVPIFEKLPLPSPNQGAPKAPGYLLAIACILSCDWQHQLSAPQYCFVLQDSTCVSLLQKLHHVSGSLFSPTEPADILSPGFANKKQR